MNWSFRILSVAGIPIRVHATFFLILLLGAYQWGTMTGTVAGAFFGVLLMVLLFVCVTLHELGHSVAALAFGIPVRQIVLLPLGGIAQISRNPDKPVHELIIAIAGPLVNVVLALLLLLVIGFTSGPLLLGPDGLPSVGAPMTPSLNTLLLWLLSANVSLVLFNLIPAFPLDGGRVLRALLAMALGYPRATRLAGGIGQLIAVGFALYGVFNGNFVLVLVAVFVFLGAGSEGAEVQARSVLHTMRAGDAYNKYALVLNVGERVSRAVDYILTSYQPDFAVLQGRRPLGIITRNDVMKSLVEGPTDSFVTEIMQRDFLQVDSRKPLDEVRRLMGEKGTRIAAVFDGESYLGLISEEDIAEAFTILTFVQRQRQARVSQAGA